ncbi:hypothetical protein ACGFWE_05785 [Streptomyces sp. NPDC048523]|uniref:hypothetical protein n=1 Tax=Streptomyces sp. NPDC048523 TaxID=3365567 RepID=UPI0037218451
MDASLLAPVAVVALLVIRAALLEIRHPGSARRQRCLLVRRRPMTAGATVSVLLSVGGWRAVGIAAVAWAVLAGALVAHIVHLSTTPGAETTGNQNGERRRSRGQRLGPPPTNHRCTSC